MTADPFAQAVRLSTAAPQNFIEEVTFLATGSTPRFELLRSLEEALFRLKSEAIRILFEPEDRILPPPLPFPE
jgi:hypothetical protein